MVNQMNSRQLNSSMNGKNNICQFRPKFRKYIHKNMGEREYGYTAKSAFMSIVLVSIWFFAMLLFANTSYRFINQMMINSANEINFSSK